MKTCVAAVIPARNEEETIADVVFELLQSKYIDEVIVISDGSTDRTAEVARESEATVFELETNQGKGQAMLHGVKQTDANILAFFDADLLGLTQDHIEQLVLPVLTGSRFMNVGLRDRGPLRTFITKHLPLISGERVMLRQVFLGVDPKFLNGYMVESSLNYYCRSRGYSYGAVLLRGLTFRRKIQKVGFFLGVIQYVKMFYQVLKAVLLVRIARMKGDF